MSIDKVVDTAFECGARVIGECLMRYTVEDNVRDLLPIKKVKIRCLEQIPLLLVFPNNIGMYAFKYLLQEQTRILWNGMGGTSADNRLNLSLFIGNFPESTNSPYISGKEDGKYIVNIPQPFKEKFEKRAIEKLRDDIGSLCRKEKLFEKLKENDIEIRYRITSPKNKDEFMNKLAWCYKINKINEDKYEFYNDTRKLILQFYPLTDKSKLESLLYNHCRENDISTTSGYVDGDTIIMVDVIDKKMNLAKVLNKLSGCNWKTIESEKEFCTIECKNSNSTNLYITFVRSINYIINRAKSILDRDVIKYSVSESVITVFCEDKAKMCDRLVEVLNKNLPYSYLDTITNSDDILMYGINQRRISIQIVEEKKKRSVTEFQLEAKDEIISNLKLEIERLNGENASMKDTIQTMELLINDITSII